MINLKVKTEYSFRESFGPIDQIIKAIGDAPAVGITDSNSTWGHVNFYKACKKAGKKPILGIQLRVVKDLEKERLQDTWFITLLAINQKGLKEIYKINSKSWEQMYYKPRTTLDEINSLSNNIIILSGSNPPMALKHDNLYFEINPGFGYWNNLAIRGGKTPLVCTSDTFFPTKSDRPAYDIVSDNPENKTTPQYILNREDFLALGYPLQALDNVEVISSRVEEYPLPLGEMVSFPHNKSLEEICRANIPTRIKEWNDEYEARLIRELELIEQKEFSDYFHLVADMCIWAKKHMLVGPARGSAAGSLVCYLMHITEVDPIPFGLIFERFIDITREDLPDIDLDFPDAKRELVIQYLQEKYGIDCVCHIGTVSRFKPKSAIGEAAKKYGIPVWETAAVKDAIIERSGGDARSAFCIKDTFESLDVGKAFIAKYPMMMNVSLIEDHARHSGCHAAGIIVCAQPITDVCSVNPKDNVAQIDKHSAESLNMLKIDVLGLRTLSVLNSCMEYLGKVPESLYQLPLDDEKAFQVINDNRFSGIFQFEGYALQSLSKLMGIYEFNDIVAITSLARPGPLHCGGATAFIQRRTGTAEVVYDHPALKGALEETFGVTVYQEQVMQISRQVGKLSWEDVCMLRKAMSKSMGDEYFNQFLVKFIKGAMENGLTEKEANSVWQNMCTFGCLSGDTIIDLPTANQHSPKSITIKELFENGGVAKVAEEKWNKQAQRDRGAKIWCDIGGSFKPERLIDVYQSGMKETFLVTLSDGKQIRTTIDHKFHTQQSGWVKLAEIHPGHMVAVIGDKFKSKKFKGTGSGAHHRWNGDGHTKVFLERQKQLRKTVEYCLVCKEAPNQETHHKDADRHNNEWNNLIPVCRKCHKKLHAEMGDTLPAPFQRGRQISWAEVISISDQKTEMTYDISMAVPYNNYVANGVSVGNSWAFNKSHAVSYALLSYFCMYLKAHHPLEFALACLNNEKSPDQTVKMLRELAAEGFKFKVFDKDKSQIEWSIADGKLLGGLTSIKGVGPSKAEDIITRRSLGRPLLAGQNKILDNAVTPWDNIFETETRFKDMYDNPEKYKVYSAPIVRVSQIQGEGEWIFIAKSKIVNLRDLNEYESLQKRGGKVIETKNLFLNLTMEDDTDSIICTVGRYDYEKMGKSIVEEGEGHYYLIKGRTQGEWRRVQIKQIRRLD